MSYSNVEEIKHIFWADISMLGVAVLWGSGFGVTDTLLEVCSPLWLLTFRFVPSGALLCLVFWKRIRRMEGRHIFWAIMLGCFLFFVFLAHVYGLIFSTPGKQSFIQGGSVVMVPLIYTVVYRRWPSRAAFAAAGLTTTGILVMAFTPGMRFNLGDFFSLLLALGVALHCIFVGNLTRKMDSCGLAALQIAAAAVCFALGALLLEPFPDLGKSGGTLLWGVPYVAIFVTVIPFLIQTVAQKHSPETHAAIILSLESLFGYFIAIALGREVLERQILCGGLLMLAGVGVVELETYFRHRSSC